MKTKTKGGRPNSLTTSGKDKIIYGLGDVGSNLIWAFTSSFLTMYYTDSVGILPGVVGTMMLVARILDGISDIAMGTIIERTHSKYGKARPWIIYFMVPFAVSLILVMNVPAGLNDTGKTVYIYLTYIFMAVICYTAVNLSYHAMLPLISASDDDRNKISSVRTIMSGLTGGGIGLFTPFLLKALGGEKSQFSWSVISAVFAALALISLIVFVTHTKEKKEIAILQPQKEKLPLATLLKTAMHNKYFFLSMLMFVFVYITNGVGGIVVYYTRDVLGNAELYSVLTLAGGASFIGVVLAPMLFKKFGKRNILLASLALSIASCLLTLLNPYNPVLFITLYVFRVIGIAPVSTALFTLAADNVDYSEWKTGIRAEGFAFSANSFGMKLGTGLGSAILGWMLALGNYDKSLAVQGEAAIHSMIVTAIVIPAVCYTALVILLLFWDLDKKLPIAQKELAQRKAAAFAAQQKEPSQSASAKGVK